MQGSFLFRCTRYYNHVLHYRLTYAGGLQDGLVWGWALDGREEAEAVRGRRHPLIECQYDYVCHAASKPRSMVHLVVLFNTRARRNPGLMWRLLEYSTIRSFITLIERLTYKRITRHYNIVPLIWKNVRLILKAKRNLSRNLTTYSALKKKNKSIRKGIICRRVSKVVRIDYKIVIQLSYKCICINEHTRDCVLPSSVSPIDSPQIYSICA